MLLFVPAVTPQAALLNLQLVCRKRLEKAVAIVDGEALEEPDNELEDSDVSSDEDKGFVATGEDDVSGTRKFTPWASFLSARRVLCFLGLSTSSMACCRKLSSAPSYHCDPEAMGS